MWYEVFCYPSESADVKEKEKEWSIIHFFFLIRLCQLSGTCLIPTFFVQKQMGSSSVLGTILSVLHIQLLWSWQQTYDVGTIITRFTDEETETQQSQVAHTRTHGGQTEAVQAVGLQHPCSGHGTSWALWSLEYNSLSQCLQVYCAQCLALYFS